MGARNCGLALPPIVESNWAYGEIRPFRDMDDVNRLIGSLTGATGGRSPGMVWMDDDVERDQSER